jgi:hypothetical protein
MFHHLRPETDATPSGGATRRLQALAITVARLALISVKDTHCMIDANEKSLVVIPSVTLCVLHRISHCSPIVTKVHRIPHY